MNAPPGWYPDPGGAPLLYRFWDGASWSASTTANPASPPPGLAPRTPERSVTDPRDLVKPRSGRGWFLAGGALLLVVIVVVVLVVRGLGSGGDGGTTGPTPGGPGSVDNCPEAVLTTTAPDQPTNGRVTSGKLSYPTLPAPFAAPKWDKRVPFGRDVQSQDAVVETSTDGETLWVASALIARLLAGDGFFGPEQGAQVVAACAVGKFYGDAEVQREDLRSEAITLDGHQAWLIEAHLRFQLPTIKTTGETMIIVVVDTGAGEAGLFYGSVPDTSPQFMKPIRDSLADLEVS